MNEYKEFELQFEIENECLLDCLHCSSHTMRTSGKRSYSDETMIDFISHFQGPIRVYFTGGEPLLYPNIVSLCRKIMVNKNNVSIGLYTTGNCRYNQPLTSEFALELAHSGITECYFSIYDNLEDVHDSFTGTPGSFKNTILSSQNCIKGGILPKAHLVLNRNNYRKIDEVITFCTEKNFSEVRILRLAPSGSAIDNWEKIGIHLSEQNQLIESLVQRKNCFGIDLSFSGYPDVYPCRSSKNAIRCQAGTNLLYVTLSGDIYPCACTVQSPDKYKLGNLTDSAKVFEKLCHQYSNVYNTHCLNNYVEY